jgi:hypothetical protein
MAKEKPLSVLDQWIKQYIYEKDKSPIYKTPELKQFFFFLEFLIDRNIMVRSRDFEIVDDYLAIGSVAASTAMIAYVFQEKPEEALNFKVIEERCYMYSNRPPSGVKMSGRSIRCYFFPIILLTDGMKAAIGFLSGSLPDAMDPTKRNDQLADKVLRKDKEEISELWASIDDEQDYIKKIKALRYLTMQSALQSISGASFAELTSALPKLNDLYEKMRHTGENENGEVGPELDDAQTEAINRRAEKRKSS